jgi:hypothetical protein
MAGRLAAVINRPFQALFPQRRTEVGGVAEPPMCRGGVPSFYIGVISRRYELKYRNEHETPITHQ